MEWSTARVARNEAGGDVSDSNCRVKSVLATGNVVWSIFRIDTKTQERPPGR